MPDFHAETHPGNLEPSNEDCIGWDTDRQVWLVADGMGGHARGEVASRLVSDTVLAEVARERPLEQAVLEAHRAVGEAARDKEESDEGMGSTVVVARLHKGLCELVWVGDSRAYLWRGGRLRRLSTDHSFLELMRSRNMISEQEAREHPQRHVVTQTLGMGNPAPGSASVELRKRDWLLLCSDGLTDELDDGELAERLAASASPKEAVAELLGGALGKEGRDNVSVIVIEADRSAPLRLTNQWLPLALGAAGGIVLFLLIWLFVFP